MKFMEERESRKSGWKLLLIIAAVVLLLLSLVPLPSRIKDGGSLYLQPVIPLYSITRWNGFGKDEGHRTAGITVELMECAD